jgi:hypothetical protein
VPEAVHRTGADSSSIDLTVRRSLCRPRHPAWDRDGCFAFDYLRSEVDAEPRRALVRAFKDGNPQAVERAALLLAAALSTRDLLDSADEPPLLVAIPGHAATRVATPVDRLCCRVQAVAAVAGPPTRSPQAEYCPQAVIRFVGPPIGGGASGESPMVFDTGLSPRHHDR